MNPSSRALDLLEQLNMLDENERVEAKRGSEIGRAVMETVCAFANEPGLQGGTLLLGVVRDDADASLPWQITGVTQPDNLSADLASRCAAEFNVPVRVDIRSESVQGKVVLVVTVPEAPPGDKPHRAIGISRQPCLAEWCIKLDRSDLHGRIIAVGKGSTFQEISLEALREIPLFRPAPDEQQRIADCLTSLDDLIAAQTQKHEALKTHKKGLMQQLFPSPEEVDA